MSPSDEHARSLRIMEEEFEMTIQGAERLKYSIALLGHEDRTFERRLEQARSRRALALLAIGARDIGDPTAVHQHLAAPPSRHVTHYDITANEARWLTCHIAGALRLDVVRVPTDDTGMSTDGESYAFATKTPVTLAMLTKALASTDAPPSHESEASVLAGLKYIGVYKFILDQMHTETKFGVHITTLNRLVVR